MGTCKICKSDIDESLPFCPFCGEPTGASPEPSDFIYEAFISYRHLPLSVKVAKRLQHDLEGFHVPKGMRGNGDGRRLGKLFRDEDELPASTSLSDQILDALAKSRFLIVVCTPETKESRWIEREIELFASLHGRDRILVALAEGERSQCLPDILLYRKGVAEDGGFVKKPTEPLAADFRESSRKSRRTETLRVAAALLGCGFDDLRQREKSRRNALVARVASVVTAASVAFAGVTLHQQHQILDKQHSLQISQSRLLAAESESLLAAGRRQEAILTALEALPTSSNDKSRPLVPEAQRALEDATGAYATKEGWTPLFARVLDIGIYDMVIDHQRGRLAAIDNNSVVHFYDLTTGERLAEVELPVQSDNESDTGDKYYKALFCANGLLVYQASGHELWCFDPATGSTLWHYECPLADEWTLDDVAVSSDGSLACCVGRYYHTEDYLDRDDIEQLDSETIFELLNLDLEQPDLIDADHVIILDLHTGTESTSCNLDRNDNSSTQCTFTEEDKRIGVTQDNRLRIIDLETLDIESISFARSDLPRLLWLDDGVIVASVDVPESNYPCSIQRFSSDGKELWRIDDYLKPIQTSEAFYEGEATPWAVITAPDSKTSQLLASLGERLMLIDMESGNIEQIATYDSPICDVLVKREGTDYRIHVCAYSGVVQYLSYFEDGINVGSAIDTHVPSFGDASFARFEETTYLATRTNIDVLRGSTTVYELHRTDDLRRQTVEGGDWKEPNYSYGMGTIATLDSLNATDRFSAKILAQASFAIVTPDDKSVVAQSGGFLYLFDRASNKMLKQSLEPYDSIRAGSFSDGGRLFAAQCEIPNDYKMRTSLHVFDLTQKTLSPQSVIKYGIMLSPDASEVLLDDQSLFRTPRWTMSYLTLDELIELGTSMASGFELTDSQLNAHAADEL